MPKYATFLCDTFINTYRDKEVPWGPIGYVTYKRTYARLYKDDDRTEEWFETVGRCVTEIAKIGRFTKEELEYLYDSVFNLKCSFSGRALWQLGTNTVEKFGGDSLMNCWATAVNKLAAFGFAFEELMLGGGIGFNIQKEYVYEIPKVKFDVKIERVESKDCNFIVPDNREGWVELLNRVLDSFFVTGKDFTYSTQCIRGRGEVIDSFGGTASGPKFLVDGIDNIAKVIRARVGEKLRPIDCLDIMNIIGSIVISGNVRRSAQIAIGDADDIEFLEAKMWGDHDIPNWRANSNNTIICHNTKKLPKEFWAGYEGKGEPYGLFNIKNARKFGRIADGTGYRPDPEVIGTNPCVIGDTRVLTNKGQIAIHELSKLDLEDIKVMTYNIDTKEMEWESIIWCRKTKLDEPIIELAFAADTDGLKITPDHKIYTENRGYAEANDIKENDIIVTLEHNYRGIHIIWDAGRADVYDLATEHNHNFFANGILVHNCGEITLAFANEKDGSGESCNLSEIFLPNIKDEDEFKKIAEIMYKVTKSISTLKFIHKGTNKIVKKNRRLGISVTGYLQAKHLMDKDVFTNVYKHIEEIDKEYSKVLKTNESIKLTTVKPSGTLSLLAGVTPGVHPAYARYYIRRIRMSSNDPLIEVCREHGYHIEPQRNYDGTNDMNTMIVSFPVKTPRGTTCAKDMTALQQLEHQKFLQSVWADNAVSCTVYYKPEELPKIQKWLDENYKFLKGTSFLLHSEHGFIQAPYEEIQKETYEDMATKVTPITRLKDNGEDEILDSLECSDGSCPIK